MSKRFKATEEQLRAICCPERGQILVSAAAGSGKTAVLAERILRLCLEEGVPPEQLAVMTFTEKAALNMKRRLDGLLEARIEAAGEDEEAARPAEELKERLALAQISTIHAFCLRLIRDYQAELRDGAGEPLLGRRFAVLDNEDAKRLLEESVSDCLAELYRAIAEKETGRIPEHPLYPCLLPRTAADWLDDLRELFAWHDRNLSDQGLREELAFRHSFLRALPDYPSWCAEALRGFASAAENPADDASVRAALDRLEGLREKAAAARRDWEEEPFFAQICAPPSAKDTKEIESFRSYYPAFSAFLGEAVKMEDPAAAWAGARALSAALADWPVLRKGKEEKQAFREAFYRSAGPLLQFLCGNLAGKAAGEEFGIEACPSPFFLSLEEIGRGSREILPAAARYLEVLLEIDRRYAEKKRRREAVDYADFEHFAYRLLSDPQVREEISRRYREILVDEYQDTSPLQEALLLALGSETYTMLGDIKQSIYRFRHAAPDIFAGKLAAFRDVGPEYKRDAAPGEEAKTGPETGRASAPVPATLGEAEKRGPRRGTRLLLNRNFRSRAAVLERVNRIFGAFLTVESGEILYNEEQALVPGRDESGMAERGPAFTLRYWHSEKELPEEAEEGGEAAEADAASEAEKTLLAGHFLSEDVEGSAQSLPVLDAVLELRGRGFAYGEIAVLCRTNTLCSHCLKMLEAAGIPAVIGSSARNLDSPELRLLEHFAALLDNFRQDYPLAAVLRSSLLGEPFREEALFRIAREGKEEGLLDEEAKSFAARFLRYAEKGSDETLRARCSDFLREILSWRERASRLSLAELFRSAVEKHGWRDRLAELPYGDRRLRDVESFLDWAEAAEGSSLADFARLMTRIREQKLQIKGRDQAPESDRAVRVMTLHAAKGLEFPAVIYPHAGAPRQSRRQSRPLFRLSVREGLAALLPAPEGLLLPPRYARFLAEEAFAERAEAFRLLYVCLTRAEEALILCATAGERDEKRLKKDLRRVEAASAEERALALAAASSDASLIVGSLGGELPGLKAEDREGGRLSPLSLGLLGDEEEDFREFSLTGEELAFSGRSLSALREGLEDRLCRQKEADEEEQAAARAPAFAAVPEEALDLLPEAGEAGREERQRLKNEIYGKLLGGELRELPSKLTVSELKQKALDGQSRAEGLDPEAGAAEAPGEAPLYPKALQEMLLRLRDPELEEEEALSPTAYGSFLHRLFQDLPVTDFADLAEVPLPDKEREARWLAFIEEEIRLLAIAPEEADTAREAWPLYRSFLDSELGRRLLRAERRGAVVRRELPFTLALPALRFAAWDVPAPTASLADGAEKDGAIGKHACETSFPRLGIPEEDEEISLLQGMIDLFFAEGEEAVLVDYKSDRIPGTPEEADAELHRRYRLQLAAYAEAIRRINGRPVKEALIWLIREGRAVPIAL